MERTNGPVLLLALDSDRRAQLEAALYRLGEVVAADDEPLIDVIVAAAAAEDDLDRLCRRHARRPPAVVWVGPGAPPQRPATVPIRPSAEPEALESALRLALRAARAERDLALLHAHATVVAQIRREILNAAPSETALRRVAEAAVALTRSTAAAAVLARGDHGAPMVVGLAGDLPEWSGCLAADYAAPALLALAGPCTRQAVGAEWDQTVAALGLPEPWRIFRAAISLPLTAGERSLGAFAVWRTEERSFDAVDQQILGELTALAALALMTSRRSEGDDRLNGEAAALREQMSDAVLLLDTDQRVVDANAAYEQLYGVRRSEIVGRLVEELPVRYFDETGAPIAGVVPSGPAYQFECGERRGWVSVSSTPLRDGEGRVVGILSVQREVTALYEAARLRLRNEALRALEHLAAGVAHDLNNALALILGSSEIAYNEVRGETPRLADLEETILAIRQAALDAANMTRRLADFARERPTAELSAVDLAELLREVASVTRPRWLNDARRRGITIALEVHTETLPPVAADPSELRDALINLIFNAVDALPTGGRIVLSAARDGNVAVIRVVDTGVGMTEAVRQRIFEPYFTTKGERGSGLGMTMVYAVVKRHRGEIAVESELGRGTTVTIRLPFSASAPDDPRSPVEDDRRGRILVLDDEPGIAAMMARMLGRDGHTVRFFTVPDEAIAAIERERFDVVVTDLGMPGFDGWDVAAAAKRRDPSTRVVLVTGWGSDLDRDAPSRVAIDAVLPKPFPFQRLREIVRSLLGGGP
ncbi:MAG: ATP-binding protein [Chloroflexota bacterium]|nr:ATP-binding protein [Dehalococcoidia bacterium]MDW8255076.1 ATP-binding protein [Chloroflexota bacterium]